MQTKHVARAGFREGLRIQNLLELSFLPLLSLTPVIVNCPDWSENSFVELAHLGSDLTYP